MRLRLLPIVIFAAAMVLSVRIGGLWETLSVGVGAPSVAQEKKAPAKKPEKKEAKKPTPKLQDKKAAKAKPVPKRKPPLPDINETDFAVLQELAKRRRTLDKRERSLIIREGVLTAVEKRLDQKLAELKRIQIALQANINETQKRRNVELDRLVKIYTSMKAKKAARVFDELAIPIIIKVVKRMKASASAPILAAMDPKRVKVITAELARREGPLQIR